MQDMMQENVDFVAFKPRRESSWRFTIAGKAKMLSEAYDETLDITQKLFEITQGFFIPTKIICVLAIVPGQIPANSVFSLDFTFVDIFEKEIKSEKGVSFPELKEYIQNIEIPKGSSKNIGRISLDGKTKFFLKDKDLYIDDKSKGLYAYPGLEYEKYITLQQVLDSPHPDNPLSISLIRDLSKGGKRLKDTDPAYYNITFLTYADIWFEKTEIGLANRNRLRNVFKKVYDNFDVVDTSFMSDKLPEKDLENVVFGKD